MFKKKYPYLSRLRISKKTKIAECKAYLAELFLMNCDLDKLDSSFEKYVITDSEKKIICEYCISKIIGLFKHAQALKTGFCNSKIINGFSEENTISICITKNTLEANEQWLTRLFKELDNRFPRVKLENKILIISSKKNTLDGHATHCTNLDSAWGYLKKNNNFKIVFICSNKIN